jgi:23S rRNA (adenine2030-N6)-methyltransferase
LRAEVAAVTDWSCRRRAGVDALNYRHAFHAGNFADVHKHSVLVRIVVHLRLKPAPFRIIDTHAGAGGYDLFAPEPIRSPEWRAGIGRLWEASAEEFPPALAPYLEVVKAFNPDGALRFYPGSPLIAAALLRPRDRSIACEIEPGAMEWLAKALRSCVNAKAVAIDGWTALGAYIPPKERRGLVLIDPPFEDANEFSRLPEALSAAYRKWPTGIYMLWYPIKERAAPDALARRLRRCAISKVLRSELLLCPPRAEGGLIGSGLIVINPPHTLEQDLGTFMPALAKLLSPRATVRTDWLVRPGRSGGQRAVEW